MHAPHIDVARIYDDAGEDPAASGARTLRVLVDRLWPRGVSRERAAIDLWPKDMTPSTGLRKTWHADPHGHDPEHFEAFKRSYAEELSQDPARTALEDLARAVAGSTQTVLLTAARHPEMSHVPVIVEALEQALRRNASDD